MRAGIALLGVLCLPVACSFEQAGEAARPFVLGGGGGIGTTPPATPPGPGIGLIAPLDVVGTAAAIKNWPLLVPGVETRAVTSFDRGGGNDDGFNGTFSELYVDDKGEHVLFDAVGPGVLRTLWFTSRISGNDPLQIGTLRFYFDGETTPRLAVDADALFQGATSPFVLPVVANNHVSTGGFASWTPLVFKQALRITAEQTPGFYHAHYETFPPDWNVASYDPASKPDDALTKLFSETGPSALPLEEIALDTMRDGAGEIDVLRFEPDGAPSLAQIRAARLKIWFDGAASPQIDVPIDTFFGSGFGEAPVHAVPWTMQPGLWESRMPMPFWAGFHVQVVGLTGKLKVHVAASRFAREVAGTLEARWHEERPTGAGDFVYADLTGAGKIVATVLTIEPLASNDEQWWEGDLRTRVDDLGSVSIHGTGHEDDHLGGWSNEFLSTPFSLPMQGCPKTQILDTTGQYNANATMYRLYPGIPFFRSVRHTTEHGAQNVKSENYGATTFLYRQARTRLVSSDAFDVFGADAAAHAYKPDDAVSEIVSSTFESETSTALTATYDSYRAPVSFELAIDPENVGVKLRRRYDATIGRQRAAVEIDGTRVTTIYVAEKNAQRRWAERDVFLPPQVTRGKTRIHVRLVPEGPFGAARFEALSVKP